MTMHMKCFAKLSLVIVLSLIFADKSNRSESNYEERLMAKGLIIRMLHDNHWKHLLIC